ncbi:MAG: DoxX family membrane protein [bacterium]|nr:DoxX family membrane protein [bacterium]
MSERTLRDRFHALSPLVLRVGIAVILLQNGLQRTSWLHQPTGNLDPTTEMSIATDTLAKTTPDGFRVNADWGSLLGAAELGVGAILIVGLLTRLVALLTLTVLGYGLVAGFAHASMPEPSTAMWLLTIACLSLLVSGSGCLSVHRRRRCPRTPESPRTSEPRTRPDEFVQARPPIAQRVRRWFSRRTPQHSRQPAVAGPARRWPWGK